MKHRISASISEDVLLRLKEKMRTDRIRNQSLLLERALTEFLERQNTQ